MKTTRTILFGAPAARLLTFARKRLKQMNEDGFDAFQRRTLRVGSARIELTKGLAGDRIEIHAAKPIYLVSINLNIGTQYEDLLYNSAKLSGQYHKMLPHITTGSGNRVKILPLSNLGLDEQMLTAGITTFSTTRDAGRTFHKILDVANSANGGELTPRPIKKGGRRGFWMSVLEMPGYVATIRRFFLGDMAPAQIAVSTGITSSNSQPNIANAAPDVVFGYQSGTDTGTRAAFFFVSRDGVTISTITTNAFLDAVNALFSGAMVFSTDCYLEAISKDVAIFFAPRPRPNATTTPDPRSGIYRMNFATGVITLTLSTDEMPIYVNCGNQCLLLVEPNKVDKDAAGAFLGYRTVRHVSLDNGVTWTSETASLPLSTVTGLRSYKEDYNSIIALSPYVDSLNKGAIYMVASITSAASSTTQGDVQIFKSIDLGMTWTPYKRVALRAALTINGALVSFVNASALQFLGPKISSVLPWARDDAYPAPAWWNA